MEANANDDHSDWSLIECDDCCSEGCDAMSFSPAQEHGSPRSDVAADLVLGQPLSPNSQMSPDEAASGPRVRPRHCGRARSAGVHVPDLLADLTPGAMVAAAASVWMGLARAWLGSAREAVAAARAATMVVARAALRDGIELSHALSAAARSTGGALEVALGVSRAAGVSAWRVAAEKVGAMHANVRLQVKARKWREPPAWVLLSLGIATTTSVAAVAALALANRSLTQQLRQRDRELAQLVCSIVHLQDALQNSRMGAPMLRHVSLSPSLSVTSLS